MTIELAISADEVDASEHWSDEDYRDFSDASFALIEAGLNEVEDDDKSSTPACAKSSPR